MIMDNSKDRLHDVFFYGLYMDPDILAQKGVKARRPRLAVVEDYVLRIGHKATLLRASEESAHGMIYSLTHDEIYSLYWGAGLDEYYAEAVLAKTSETEFVALCCNLLNPPASDESNPEYTEKLRQVMTRLGVPAYL